MKDTIVRRRVCWNEVIHQKIALVVVNCMSIGQQIFNTAQSKAKDEDLAWKAWSAVIDRKASHGYHFFQMLEYIFDDRLFVSYTCPYLWFISAALVVVLELFINMKAPYGRYNTSNAGIPVRTAWFIQELPSFVVPCYLLYHHGSSVSFTNFVIVGWYLIHYFQR